jgi:hypothetical protein
MMKRMISVLGGMTMAVAVTLFASQASAWPTAPTNELQILFDDGYLAKATDDAFIHITIVDDVVANVALDAQSTVMLDQRWRTNRWLDQQPGWIEVALMLIAPANYHAVLVGPD